MAWTKKDIERTGLKHNLHDLPQKNNVLLQKVTTKDKISIEKENIKKVLWVLHREAKIPDYVEELQFLDDRKFRFDWAIPSLKLAIEYEGLISKKSRHTTITGYTNDCIKYNLAVIHGWKVLRYTAKNYNQLADDLKILLKK